MWQTLGNTYGEDRFGVGGVGGVFHVAVYGLPGAQMVGPLKRLYWTHEWTTRVLKQARMDIPFQHVPNG